MKRLPSRALIGLALLGLPLMGGTVVAIPVTILFLLVQKRLVGGLTAGAVKA